MKVLQILPELNAGGVERTTLEMAEALTANGHSAHICSNGGRLEPEFTTLGAKLHIFKVGSKNPLKLRGNAKRLIDIIKTENIDIVHARSRAPAWPAHAAAKATNRPFLTTYHGIYNAKSGAKRRYNAIMARGDLIIANSEYTKAHVIKQHGTDPALIRVIPRGVDMRVFDPKIISDDNILAQKQAWGLNNEAKIILLPARLTRWKGQLVAIEALSRLDKDWHLVLMGDAQGREKYVGELNQVIGELGLSNRVKLPGHSSNVPAALMAAQIVIAPSIEPEAFGRTVAEAQAMGKPVIAAAHGGPLETVLEDRTGKLVPPSDPSALAKAVEMIDQGDNYDEDFARNHIAKNYSKTGLQEKTMAVYQELLM